VSATFAGTEGIGRSPGPEAMGSIMAAILLVEDHEDVRDMLVRRLRRRDFEVAVAADGRSAIERCATDPPDLVLLDVNLPELDGWTVARRLKADPRSAGIPIIAVTAYAALEDRARAREAGCDDFHPKPIDFSRLVSQIEAALGPVPQPMAGRVPE
jgi:two-component system cell cycle response regulator DivK